MMDHIKISLIFKNYSEDCFNKRNAQQINMQ